MRFGARPHKSKGVASSISSAARGGGSRSCLGRRNYWESTTDRRCAPTTPSAGRGGRGGTRKGRACSSPQTSGRARAEPNQSDIDDHRRVLFSSENKGRLVTPSIPINNEPAKVNKVRCPSPRQEITPLRGRRRTGSQAELRCHLNDQGSEQRNKATEGKAGAPCAGLGDVNAAQGDERIEVRCDASRVP
jgi:hypothetical protein